jgi:hypothetical protein
VTAAAADTPGLREPARDAGILERDPLWVERDVGCERAIGLAAGTALGVAVLLTLVVAGLAGAYTFGLVGPNLASTASPFTACPVGAADANSVNYPNTEPEPFVAVNPTNPLNVVGVYQQDRWNDGAAKAQGTAVSTDGGASWTSHAFVPFSECAGGNPDYDRATDPWVTFDPNGNAYQISLSASANLQISAVQVSKSTDGGLTWGNPKELIRDESGLNFNDKESITADPTRSGYVYAVWDRISFASDKLSPIATFHSSHTAANRCSRGRPTEAQRGRRRSGSRTRTSSRSETRSSWSPTERSSTCSPSSGGRRANPPLKGNDLRVKVRVRSCGFG